MIVSILGCLVSAVVIGGLCAIVKFLIKKNIAVVFSVLIGLILSGSLLFFWGEKTHSIGIGLSGLYLAMGPAIIFVLIFPIWLIAKIFNLPLPTDQKPTEPSSLHFKNNKIVYFQENWTIDQFSHAEKFSDLFVDYCEIGGWIRIVKVLNYKIYFAVMPIETKDSKRVLFRHITKEFMDIFHNENSMLETDTELIFEANKELIYKELLDNMWYWHTLEEINKHYPKSHIRSMVQALNKSDDHVNEKNEINKKNKLHKKNMKNERNKKNKLNKKNEKNEG